MCRTLPVLALVLAAGACAREPVNEICPDVAEGDLVISEIRGDQSSSTDQLGEWIEIYNATGAVVPLQGLALTMRRTNGAAEARILVRTAVVVAAQDYAVLGSFPSGAEPDYVTYGYFDEFPDHLYGAAQLELASCGRVLDTLVYRSLPTQGTVCFDGGRSPDALANDDASFDRTGSGWCQDADGATNPGSPLMRNRPCAP